MLQFYCCAGKEMGKFLQTVAAMACLKSLLMIFNLAFWVCKFIFSLSQIERDLKNNSAMKLIKTMITWWRKLAPCRIWYKIYNNPLWLALFPTLSIFSRLTSILVSDACMSARWNNVRLYIYRNWFWNVYICFAFLRFDRHLVWWFFAPAFGCRWNYKNI